MLILWDDNRLRAIAIIGTKGVGKTRLCETIFNKEEENWRRVGSHLGFGCRCPEPHFSMKSKRETRESLAMKIAIAKWIFASLKYSN
ncbi:P-loop containing nucleoside triphosphate hydrolase [Trema orientale]|uniref:P-loop containing nucleoside triphosphate hydrolase n=1 Tax=Trema orientale TaxID=63057 RepID=A0A2P5FGU5_TREOI|nr:P-loop containing nucleoside triphosphate hydrolase [Trema orientale]